MSPFERHRNGGDIARGVTLGFTPAEAIFDGDLFTVLLVGFIQEIVKTIAAVPKVERMEAVTL